jgi:hypothetical protein
MEHRRDANFFHFHVWGLGPSDTHTCIELRSRGVSY